jgi:hypothetical protein
MPARVESGTRFSRTIQQGLLRSGRGAEPGMCSGSAARRCFLAKLNPGLPGLLIASALAAGVLVTLRPARSGQWDTVITVPLIDAVYGPGGADGLIAADRCSSGECHFQDLENRVLELDQNTRDLIARCLVAGELRARLSARRSDVPAACLVLGPKGCAGDTNQVLQLRFEANGPGRCPERGACQFTRAGNAGRPDEPALALLREPRLSARLLLARPAESENPGAVTVSSRLILRLNTARRNGV